MEQQDLKYSVYYMFLRVVQKYVTLGKVRWETNQNPESIFPYFRTYKKFARSNKNAAFFLDSFDMNNEIMDSTRIFLVSYFIYMKANN